MLTDLADVPGGTTRIGSDDGYPEEAPAREVPVAEFRLERHPVTVAQFAAFTSSTGYRTEAERARPGSVLKAVSDPRLRLPGSLVFVPSARPVPVTPTPEQPEPWRQWWRFVPGASWHHPLGPMAGWDARDRMADHPVVHVTAADARAYARWAGRRLPTAVELEHAARAGSTSRYSWGDDAEPARFTLATTWEGRFPVANPRFTDVDAHRRHGWVGTSPVGAAVPNAWGLCDLIGNVWEWTSTPARDGPQAEESPCCGAKSRPGADEHVVKGGSHLCAPEYCHRYRPAALQLQSVDSSSTHLGFRCAV